MHYSDAQLRSFLRDDADVQIDLVDATQVSHLDECEFCQRRLAELSGEGDWLRDCIESISSDTCDLESVSRSSSVVLCTSPSELADHGLRCDSVRLDFLETPRHPELLGRLGRYDIERLIGIGGFGVVFKAHDSELNRVVAIKVLAPHLMSSAAARQRFAREAQASAAIVHDHVVPIYDVVSTSTMCYFVMQYIAGNSLQQRVDRDGALPTKDVLRIAAQMAAGLEAAHEQGLIHRDVKPGNILLEDSVDRVLISDFGLARTADDGNLTRSGAITGTPHYMSPEQAHGDAIDARSDLFSLGSVIYFMCTGHSPFRAAKIMAVLHRICSQPHRPLGEIDPAIPIELERLVDRLLSKSAHDRPATATETRAELNRILSDVQSGRTRPRRAPTTMSNVRMLAGLCMATGALILAASVWMPKRNADDKLPVAPTIPQQDAPTTLDVPLAPVAPSLSGSDLAFPVGQLDPFLSTLQQTWELIEQYEQDTPWSQTLPRGPTWQDNAMHIEHALQQLETDLGTDPEQLFPQRQPTTDTLTIPKTQEILK